MNVMCVCLSYMDGYLRRIGVLCCAATMLNQVNGNDVLLLPMLGMKVKDLISLIEQGQNVPGFAN